MLTRYTRIFTLLVCMFFVSIQAKTIGNPFWDAFPELLTNLEAFYPFEGDIKGEFRGDLSVILSDGSAWKTHPDDQEMVAQWHAGDYLSVCARTSFYWFKREHKFRLYNHERDESVKVMLVKHRDHPLEIIATSDVYIKDVEMIPIFYYDQDGNLQLFWHFIFYYNKDLYLNDGSKWVIDEKFGQFLPRTKVYVGANVDESSYSFFLICGRERESTFAWASNLW